MIINFAPLGSSGGSGSGSTVAWQQTVTAGTQIARITIDGTSQNVYAPEGGGSAEQDYIIVEALSAITSPTEGMFAYVPEHTVTMSGYTILDIEQTAYNNYIKRYIPQEDRWRVGDAQTEGLNFTFTNDGNIRYEFSVQNVWFNPFSDTLFIKSFTGGSGENRATLLYDPNIWTFEMQGYSEYYEQTADTVTVSGRMYIYTKNKWYEYKEGRVTFNRDFMTVSGYAEMKSAMTQFDASEVQFEVSAKWESNGYKSYKYLLKTNALDQNKMWATATEGKYNYYGEPEGVYTIAAVLDGNGDPNTWAGEWVVRRADPTVGSSVSYSQTLSAGTEIGQITIDGSATTIYAPAGGGSQGPTVIDFDAMSQSELATFYAELASVWSATSVNGDYVFLKSFADYTPENAGTRQIRLQFLWIEGTTAYFGTATRKADNDNAILSWGLDLGSDGTISTRTNGVNGVSKDTQLVSYFNTWNQSITFDKSTSGFTTNSEPMTDGMAFGGSFYWFIVNAAQGDWGQAIPLLLFDVVDESGNTKTYQYPTISKQSVSETISGVSYTLSVTADYGDFCYKMLLNENPYGAQFQYIEKPKVQGISQAAYDALVSGGTVDANTLYVII